MSYYDPYKVLQVSYTADLSTIRDAFKRMALLHHPDRGGNHAYFDLCKRAYTDIYNYKTQQQAQLQRENMNYTQYKQQRASNNNFVPQLDKNQQKHLQRNFNQVFQNVRVETANDIGYGDMMEKSSQNRDDNPTLDESKRFKKNQLILYEEPEPLPTITENYEVLGEGKIKDFSNHSKGYTDYMVAHSEQDSIEKLASMENVRQRQSFKSVDELRSARSNISYQMSPEELHKYNMRQQREKEMEEQRKMNFYQHKQNVERKMNQITNFLTI